MSSDCLFCKIIAGEIPAEIVAENEHTVGFRDINPQAPTHVLIIPRIHEPNIGALAAAAPHAAAALLTDARAIAAAEGAEDDYRLVFNTGADAQQTVFHCHGHVLAGRTFGWPPG
ncbi:MAG: HIT domain-containing protein [Aeromicrobium sp.]